MTDHTKLKDFKFNTITKTIIDRYLITIGKAYDKDILDFGCGNGHGCALMLSYGAKSVVGVDIDKDTIKEAKEQYVHIFKEKALTFTSDLNSIKDNTADIITSFECIEHIKLDELKGIINKLKHILKEEGIFLLSIPIERHGRYSQKEHYGEVSEDLIISYLDTLFGETNWDLHTTIEHTDGKWINTSIIKDCTAVSNCWIITARNDKKDIK